MNVPEGTPMDTSVSAVEQARCLPPGRLRQEYLDLLELLGHGRFQLRVLFCAHLSLVMLLFHNWSAHVLTQPVDHWCKPPALFAHLTRDQWLNVSVPIVEDSHGNRHHSQCAMYDLSTIVFNGSRLEVPCDAWDYDLPPDTNTMVSKWDLVCERASYVPMAHAYYTVGGVLGAPLLGQLADRAGRRPVVFGGLLLSMLSVFVATAADSFTPFVAAHAIVALSATAVHVLTSVLLFESSSSAYRTLYIAAAETGAPLMHAASLCPWLQGMDLRLARITLVLSMILLSLAFHAVAESPRWLLAVGRYDALTAVLARLAQANGVQLGDVWRLVHYAEVVKPLQIDDGHAEPGARAPDAGARVRHGLPAGHQVAPLHEPPRGSDGGVRGCGHSGSRRLLREHAHRRIPGGPAVSCDPAVLAGGQAADVRVLPKRRQGHCCAHGGRNGMPRTGRRPVPGGRRASRSRHLGPRGCRSGPPGLRAGHPLATRDQGRRAARSAEGSPRAGNAAAGFVAVQRTNAPGGERRQYAAGHAPAGPLHSRQRRRKELKRAETSAARQVALP
ncbi:organic cation transporter protein-like isoform X2 [Dermacentor albipictus]|uniref:organic cation transporter protein-like isoform X2 n=1 Tax=Dermacentor albipictus TaxID=60249 RepID=UPI0031FCC663